MKAKLLEGKIVAEKYQKEIAKEFSKLYKMTKQKPKMVAVKVNEDLPSELYLKSQRRAAEATGVDHETIALIGTTQRRLLSTIHDLNRDPKVHGIMLQMPLPEGFHLEEILDSIDPKKDVEGVTSYNLGQLVLKKNRLVPCTALASIALIDETGEELYGKEAVVVGSSKVVGRPVTLLLLERMVTTTVCHVATFEAGKLEQHVRRADILVVGVGKANVIPGSWIKEGSIVIDVGINRVENKTVGDVEFEVAKERAKYITPVPGGVGPLTVTILMKNLLTAFRWQCSDKTPVQGAH